MGSGQDNNGQPDCAWRDFLNATVLHSPSLEGINLNRPSNVEPRPFRFKRPPFTADSGLERRGNPSAAVLNHLPTSATPPAPLEAK